MNKRGVSVINGAPPPVAQEEEQLLFRPEVAGSGQLQWLGSVVVVPGPGRTAGVVFAVVMALSLVAYLIFGEYTRRESVKGWVVPDRGLIRIFAPQAGVVSSVQVADGQEVKEGTVMLAVSAETQTQSLGATRQEIVRQLQARRASLANERQLRAQLQQKETANIEERLRALETDRRARAQELEAQKRRVELSTATYERLAPLMKKGIIPAIQMEQLEDERLDRLGRLKVLERERSVAAQERATLEAELRALPLKHQADLAELDRSAAAIEQELASVESEREQVIVASQTGTVTALQVKRGGSASPNVPLLSIIPSGSVLEAELFVPSRARGFIRTGQRVLLRYQAFPYQKFGLFEGSVVGISRSSVSPAEMTRERAGALGLGDAAEPVYQVRVRLLRQSVMAYGREFPLQPGMQLEADIEIEHRRLYEWMLDPLYALSGRQV